jgi:diaminohydroxyphosphoribosylaminopyrimidine deaminase / 5-amino-6-(5-phosphoribosylamino)uracil reductase
MNLALELAESAKGKTNPNPLVGALLVKNGVIVGSGLHRKAGEPHAEVHAFRMAGDHAKDATLYVTLEPCSHFGRTPPCAELVKDSGVSRVVVAMEDPNPIVAGRGIKILRDAGIEVEVGIKKKEAELVNERFIHNMLTQTPFIISKVAMTLDGKLATHNGHSQWVTGDEARNEVHVIRDKVDAIMVGIGTVLTDNPRLTTRLPEGGKNPVRIILDSNLRIPLESLILDTTEAKTWVITKENVDPNKVAVLREKGVEVIFSSATEEGIQLPTLMKTLYSKGITDILLEGGSGLNGTFLRERLINKFLFFIAPKVLGGLHSLTPFAGANPDQMHDALDVDIHSIEKFGVDLCLTAYPKKENGV